MFNWSEQQLRAAVAAYADMSERLAAGEAVTKQHIYIALALNHGRTASAYKRRFYNISYVLTTMGLSHIPGINSLSHVGAAAEAIIRQAILDTPYFAGDISTLPIKPAALPTLSIPVLQGLRPVPPGNTHPAKTQVIITRVDRIQAVVDWVLAVAAGHCENCGQPAPFERTDGTPYLEVHHIKQLSDGGSDLVTNAVALCPNCHRRLHYGADAASIVSDIIARIPRLIAED